MCPTALLVNDQVPYTNHLCRPEVLWFITALSNIRSQCSPVIPVFLTSKADSTISGIGISTHSFVQSFFPPLKHTQQLPDSHYIDAPRAAKGAHRVTAASSRSFLLFRYVLFH